MANIRWGHDSAIAEARRHSNRASLFRATPGAYQYLKRHKLLDELLPRVSRKRWTYQAIRNLCEQNRIKTKQELALICPTAHRAIYRNKDVDGVLWVHKLFPTDHGQ